MHEEQWTKDMYSENKLLNKGNAENIAEGSVREEPYVHISDVIKASRAFPETRICYMAA